MRAHTILSHHHRRRRQRRIHIITCEAQRFPACTLAWHSIQQNEPRDGWQNEERKKFIKIKKSKGSGVV